MHRPNPATKRRCARVHPTGAGVGRRRGFVPYRLDSSPHRRRGWTDKEIGESEDVSEETARMKTQEFPELGKLGKPNQTIAAYAEEGWTPPIYNPTPFLPEFYLSLARVVITSAIVGNAHQPTVHRRKTALKAIVARAI